MQQPSLQDRLFEIILSRYPRRADAVEDLCSLLNLAKDPIYRRLRGDTFLPPEELSLLAQKSGLSFGIFRRICVSRAGKFGRKSPRIPEKPD